MLSRMYQMRGSRYIILLPSFVSGVFVAPLSSTCEKCNVFFLSVPVCLMYLTSSRLVGATLLVLSLLFFMGCDGDSGVSDPEPDPGPQTGTVIGVVTAADGETPIQGVTVGLATDEAADAAQSGNALRPLNTVLSPVFAVQTDGPTTTTDADGAFTLEDVPTGEQTLIAKRGVFEATFTVTVPLNDVIAVDEVDLDSVQPLGYVPGEYDSIEDVVLGLGNEDVDELSPESLGDADLLGDYAMVFVNCGSDSFTEERAAVLADYVNQGGTLYISDLEAPYVEALFPDDISFTNDSFAEELEGRVTAQSLRDWIRRGELTITYDAPSWSRITNLEGDAEVLVHGQPSQLDEGNEPLAITFSLGSGRVVYTTFHNTVGLNIEQESVLRYYIYLDS